MRMYRYIFQGVEFREITPMMENARETMII